MNSPYSAPPGRQTRAGAEAHTRRPHPTTPPAPARGRIDDDARDRARAVPIADVLARLAIERIGGRWWCPTCQPTGAAEHHTPDLTISREPTRWYCFRHGGGGDAIDLVRATLGLGCAEAVDWIADAAGARPAPPRPPARPQPPALGEAERIAVLEAVAMRCELTPAVLSYAASRGWSEDDLRHVGITGPPPAGAIGDLMREHGPALRALGLLDGHGRWAFREHPLMFWFFDAENRIAYLQARRIDDGQSRWRCIRGAVPCVWNLGVLLRCYPPGHTVYLTEGIPDAAAIMAADRGRIAVALPGASTPTPDLLRPLTPYAVIVCGDNDEAGRQYNARCASILHALGATVRIATPPEKDCAETLVGGAA